MMMVSLKQIYPRVCYVHFSHIELFIDNSCAELVANMLSDLFEEPKGVYFAYFTCSKAQRPESLYHERPGLMKNRA